MGWNILEGEGFGFMTVTIELPDELGAALKAQARAQGISLAGFRRHVLEQAVQTSVRS
jgi:hypothetical protein